MKVFVVNRETGSYSDYRCTPLWYFNTEDEAKEWCAAAEAARRMLHEKIEKIESKYDGDMDDEYGAKSRAAINRAIMANKLDQGLCRYETSDASYSVTEVKKYPHKETK